MVVATVLITELAILYITAPKDAWFEGIFIFFYIWAITAILGTILTLIGGRIAKPRYLWIPLTIVGGFYCLSAVTEMVYTNIHNGNFKNIPIFRLLV